MADFISVTELGDHLGRDLTADPGATLAVNFACDAVRTVAGQDFTAGSSTVTLDGSGTDALLLPERPVSRVRSVTVAGTAVTDFSLRSDGTIVRPYPAVWTAGRQNVVIRYEHGVSRTKVPPAVRMVALALAARFVVQGPAAAETVGEETVRYSGEATALLPTERLILDLHRAR
jgi:hypothetical protein